FAADGTAFISAALPSFVNSFFAFSPYAGDISLAAGDTNGDGTPDIVVGSTSGTRGNVRVFSGANNSSLANYFAYPAGTTTGASVGLADVNTDGLLEVVATPIAAGQQANVSAFDLTGTAVGSGFAAFSGFRGGSTVAGARF
ncbi:MAG: VCBS repeat-containing protein, partial [Gemmataceae bacterium]|nr:VCBS repeat-containing protein [Gemmataceae bacterium]